MRAQGDGMNSPPVVAREGDFVDAHVHFWDPGHLDYPWLHEVPALLRPLLPADLVRENRSTGADLPAGVVVVEADRAPDQALAEVEWVLGLSSVGPRTVGVVAHADVERGADCAGGLGRLVVAPGVVGVRRLLQDQRPGFSTRPGFVAGVALVGGHGLPFDLCIRSHQLPEVTELVRRLPEVLFVLDHLGKPEVTASGYARWAADLARLAALPNVRCKLSGLATEADPGHRTAADLAPFLRHAVDVFGPSRTMFGSDWPVLTLATSYARWLDLVRDAVDDLDADDRDLVMRGTALTTYGPADRRRAPSEREDS